MKQIKLPQLLKKKTPGNEKKKRHFFSLDRGLLVPLPEKKIMEQEL